MITSKSYHACCKAFTLVENLIVIAVIAILMVVILGSLPAIKASLHASKCIFNLHQIGSAFYLYAAEHNQTFPDVSGDSTASDEDERNGKGKQWDEQLRSYLEVPATSPSKSPLKKTVYYCPESEGDPSYKGKPVVLLSYTYNAHTPQNFKSGSMKNFSTIMLLADLQLANSTDSKSYVPKIGQGRNNTIIFYPSATYNKFLAYRHKRAANILFLDGHVAPRHRLVENDQTSPPADVRWTVEDEE